MGRNPSIIRGSPEAARYPVENVLWQEAAEFCRLLTERGSGGGLTYRLPTEAEWEYACRAAGTSLAPFHVGTRLSSTQANFNGSNPYGGAAKGSFLERASVVGSYAPNAFGLCDMHGNVWEWCADWLNDLPPGPAIDPAGPEGGMHRVIRGGSWRGEASYCRSARRGGGGTDFRYDYLGFRVAAER